MGDWRVAVDANAALAVFVDLETRMETRGVERVAAKAAAVMHEESETAFARGADPITGQPWAPAAETTLKAPGFRSLLVRSGQMRAGVRSGYKLTPRGGRAFLNVEHNVMRRALVHLYGVEQKKARTYTIGTGRYAGRTRSRRRERAWAKLPARRFVGLSPAGVSALFDYARHELTGMDR